MPDVAALVQSVTGQGPAPTEPEPAAEVVAGVPVDQFTKAISELSGGTVKDVETFKRVTQDVGQLTTLQARLQELEAKAALSPYHSPFTEKIDAMVREGRAIADVQKFVELNALDLKTLSPVDALRRQYALDRPGYTPEQLDGLIERDLGFDPTESDLSNKQTGILREKTDQAIAALQGMQVATENPAAIQAAREAQERAHQVVSVWQQVLPQLPVDQKISVPMAEGVTTDLTFKPSAEAVNVARESVMAMVQQNPAAFPPTEETAKALSLMFNNFVSLADQARRDEAIARDAHARATQAALQRVSGNGAALNRPAGTQQTIPNQPTGKPFSFIGD